MGTWAERTLGKAVAELPGQARLQIEDWPVPHLRADKLGGTTGERDRLHNPEYQHMEIKLLKPLTENTCGD